MKNILMKHNKTKHTQIKVILSSILVSTMLSNPTLSVFSSKPSSEITFTLGSNIVYYDKVKATLEAKPIIRDGRTLIPVRNLVEGIGGEVDWNGIENKVTIVYMDKFIELVIDKKDCFINEKKVKMDTAPIIYNKRAYLPLRFICEKIGYDVSFNNASQKITVFKKAEKQTEKQAQKPDEKQSEYYLVKKGDTLSDISAKFNIKLVELKKINNLSSNSVVIGEKIYLSSKKEESKIPKETVKEMVKDTKKETEKENSVYIVKTGDTLSSISKKYNITIKRIKEMNKLSKDNVTVGQKLNLKTK